MPRRLTVNTLILLGVAVGLVGLPTEAIALLLPIDRLPDTSRTAVNVEGDRVGSLIVERLALGTSGPAYTSPPDPVRAPGPFDP